MKPKPAAGGKTGGLKINRLCRFLEMATMNVPGYLNSINCRWSTKFLFSRLVVVHMPFHVFLVGRKPGYLLISLAGSKKTPSRKRQFRFQCLISKYSGLFPNGDNYSTGIAKMTAVGTGLPLRVPGASTVALLKAVSTASFFGSLLSTPNMPPLSLTKIVKKLTTSFL